MKQKTQTFAHTKIWEFHSTLYFLYFTHEKPVKEYPFEMPFS